MKNVDSIKKKAYLFGSPVAHSISPAMHNYSFKALGIDAEYEAVDIDIDNISAVTEYIRSDDFLGANVTMPLKTKMTDYVDSLNITSFLSGSVNTIVPVDNELVGYTTDGDGFVDSLAEIGVNVTGKKILILGAGGAAKAIIVKCALDKAASITIAKRNNKTIDEVIAFTENVTKETMCNVDVIDIGDEPLLQDAVADSDILINATPVGMTDNNTLIDKRWLRPELIVTDLIYEPDMTPLLISAKECGCKYMNGKYMLLYQGARGFKLWTKMDMPVEEVKETYFRSK